MTATKRTPTRKLSPNQAVLAIDDETKRPMAAVRAAYASGDDTQALELAAKLLTEAPDNKEALLVTARIHNRTKAWQEALGAWRALCDLDPQATEPHLQLARLHQRTQNWAEANQSAQRLLALQSDHEEALRIGLNSQLRLNDDAAALESSLRLLELGSVAEATASLKLAAKLFEAGKNLDAARLSTALAKVAPANTDAAKLHAKVMTFMLTDALAAHLEGDDNAAAEICRDILKIVPDHARANSVLSEILRPSLLKARAAYKAGEIDASIADYANVLTVNPDHVESLRALGRIYNKAKNLDAARPYWSRLEQLTPNDPEPALQLARAQARSGQTEDAYLRFSALAAIGGSTAEEAADTVKTLAARLVRAAAVFARDGALDEAWRIWSLLQQGHHDIEAMTALRDRIARLSQREASTAFKAPDFAAAVAHAQRAIAANPLDEKSLAVLARSAHKVASYKLAQQAWMQLRDIRPEAPEPHLQCARYHLRFKEYAQALASSEKLLAIESTHEEALRIQQTASASVNANAK